MTLIAHISDLHISPSGFDEKVYLQVVEEINKLKPDMIILTGDITDVGYYKDFQKAVKYLDMFDAPLFAVPGNHDSRNIGYETFEELIGDRSWKLTKEDEMVIVKSEGDMINKRKRLVYKRVNGRIVQEFV